MSERGPTRRLCAILAADIAAYTTLVEDDTEGTVAAWTTARRDIIEVAIEEFSGRIVKLTGDGFLAEFPTVEAAVKCAISMQQALSESPLNFRMGISLGDVVDDGEDIHGEGVNIAARIEALAETGGICISGGVHDQVRNRVHHQFVDMGEHKVKHVSMPVRVWKWDIGIPTDPVDISQPVPGFDGRPAIAVLPFENRSSDPDQKYLADGIAEDILTRLATWRWLPVIGRNSSFSYAGHSVHANEVGRRLGARYVLEGSIRKAGSRVRVTSQLSDTETGHQVWAERYDRALEDLFELQDEITDSIVAALEPAVGRAEMQRAQRKKPENLDAWDHYQQGLWSLSKVTESDLVRAREMFEKSSVADPNFASPLAGIGLLGFLEVTMGFAPDRAQVLEASHEAALRAVRLDELDPFSLTAHGYMLGLAGAFDAGIASAERAVKLNPSFALGYHCLHSTLFFSGRYAESLDAAERACRLSPNDPWIFYSLTGLSACNYMLRNYELAVARAKVAIERYAQYPGVYRWLAVSLAQLGQRQEARMALTKFLELSPAVPSEVRQAYPFRNEVDLAHYLDGLSKAGLPE